MSRSRSAVALLVLVAALAALPACQTVQLVSDYDEVTDAQVSALQQFVDDSLVALESASAPACLHEHHGDFYSAERGAVGRLLMRNEARGSRNSVTTDQIRELQRALGLFEQTHRNASTATPPACLPANRIELDRSGINTIFRAILTLELAKKRGDNDQ